MEIHDFKGRLRMLAGEVAPAAAAAAAAHQACLSGQQIMGRLWSAGLARKAQRSVSA